MEYSQKKRRLEARLDGIQCKMGTQSHRGLIKLKAKIRKDLEEVLYQEELLWYQRSREEWITSGDKNTNYYHAATRVRRATNKIHALRNDNGVLETDERHVKEQVLNFFKDIFKEEGGTHQVSPIPKGFPKVTDYIHLSMCREITKDEVKMALFDMSPYKAPGPDGFHAGFYQRAWNTIGDDVTYMVKDFSKSGALQDIMNDTLLSLIPKLKSPEKVSQLRPISLCNVHYKIVTKVIANRIKEFLDQVIGQEQSSFVPQRQIVDNIVTYQEALHSMRSKKGNVGHMVLKIDLEKAYDKLSWNFLQETLQEVGLSQQWVKNIMACVTTSRLVIIWNGD